MAMMGPHLTYQLPLTTTIGTTTKCHDEKGTFPAAIGHYSLPLLVLVYTVLKGDQDSVVISLLH